MFTQKTIEQAWSLYQASLKHSDFEIDFHKLFEERTEFENTMIVDVDDNDDLLSTIADSEQKVIEEFTDYQIMLLRFICYTLKPKSLEQLELYVQNMSEVAEHKTERTLDRFESGYYKK